MSDGAVFRTNQTDPDALRAGNGVSGSEQTLSLRNQLEEATSHANAIHGLCSARQVPASLPTSPPGQHSGWLAALGLTPANTVSLEVTGRRSGRSHAFVVTTAAFAGERYLVSLAGESDWVRNLRAADDCRT